MTLQDLVADSVARIDQADQEALEAAAAFAAGRFQEYWDLKINQMFERIHDRAVAERADSGTSS